MKFKDKEDRQDSAQKKRPVDPSTGYTLLELKLQGRKFFGVFYMVLIPCILLAGFGLRRVHWLSFLKEFQSHTNGNASESFASLKPGPWGTIEVVPFALEIPDLFVSGKQDEASDHRWFFGGHSIESVKQFLGTVHLNANEKELLLDSSKWETRTNGLYVNPAREVILSLSPQARAEIYSFLAQFRENTWQREDTFSCPAESLPTFFSNSDLSNQTVELVKKLCWPRGKLLLFSDLPTVLGMLKDPKEKLNLEKALTRRPTMLLKLHVSPSTDINRLIDYWGRAGQDKDLRPLLQSLVKLPNGASVDIVHVIPPLPTARLYTYAFPSFHQPENCHWTSFNFFRDPPDDRYTDVMFCRKKLDTDYYPVFSDPRYGDLVFLTKPAGEIVHSAVYIADDIVYSKNGGHYSAPWLLMKLSDLIDAYATFVGPNEQVKILYYRNKYY